MSDLHDTERVRLGLLIDPNALEIDAYPWPLDAADRVMAGGFRDSARALEEIEYWKSLFFQAVEDLKPTHVNVYKYTLGLPPSPYERDRARERLEELREKARNAGD